MGESSERIKRATVTQASEMDALRAEIAQLNADMLKLVIALDSCVTHWPLEGYGDPAKTRAAALVAEHASLLTKGINSDLKRRRNNDLARSIRNRWDPGVVHGVLGVSDLAWNKEDEIMKFKIKDLKDRATVLELTPADDEPNDGDPGSVSLKANGVTLLWICRDGSITLNACDEDRLRRMGFRMYGGHVDAG